MNNTLTLQVGDCIFTQFRIKSTMGEASIKFNDNGLCFCNYTKPKFDDVLGGTIFEATITLNSGVRKIRYTLENAWFDADGKVKKTDLSILW